MKRLSFCFIVVLFMFLLCGCVKTYEVTLIVDDEVFQVITFKEGEVKELPNVEKEGHQFDGWKSGDVDNYYTTELLIRDNVKELTPNFIPNKYDFEFYVDGVRIHAGVANYGDPIIYPEEPEKDPTAEFSYEFIGWDKDDKILTEDITFNAVFKEIKNVYRYIFLDANGKEIKNVEAEYGSTIEYPENPEKAPTAEFSYEFIGWDKEDTILTENITFKPVYKQGNRIYSVKFVYDDGTVIMNEMGVYGSFPIIPENVTKESNDGKQYRFIGWDKEVTEVTGDAVYTAQFVEFVPTLENKKISFLGDSITTFYAEGSEMNSYYGGTNQFYYPTYSASVKTVDKTWWYQLIKNNNMQLGINNSWSGSCAYGSGSSAGTSDGRINTIDDNGTPEIVIIYLGTNDCASAVSTSNFKTAIETMIKKVRKLNVQDIFLMTLGYSAYTGASYSDVRRVEYNKITRELAEKYQCGVIPLDDYIQEDSYMFYLGDNLHYNAKGATLLAEISEKAMKEYYGLEYEGEIEVERKEQLPDGAIGILNVTSNSNFWGGYANNVFFMNAEGCVNPDYSLRIEISKKSDGTYYVSNIQKSGTSQSFNCDYVIIISDAHNQQRLILSNIENIAIGNVVEFDNSKGFPFDVLFK